MLTIKCAKCKTKLFKYNKIGKGSVIKCYNSRITKWLVDEPDGDLRCLCNSRIGINKGSYYKMIPKTFKYTGTKENK